MADQEEASLATLKRLAEAVEGFERNANTWSTAVMPALIQYRAEIAPLRTRGEVDAEIAHEVRYYSNMQPPGIGPQPTSLIAKLNELSREPTREGEAEPECDFEREVEEADARDYRVQLEREIASLVTWGVTRSWGSADHHGGVLLIFDKHERERKAERLSELCMALARLGKAK